MALKENDHERGAKNKAVKILNFEMILVIGLFTGNDLFCREYQNNRRSQHGGCKFNFSHLNFKNGLENLHFAQQMGEPKQFEYFQQKMKLIS